MYILYLYFILLFAACSRTFRYAWLSAQPVFSCLYLCVCVSQSVGVRVMQIFRLPSTVEQSEFYDFCLLPLDSYNIRVYIQYLNNRYAVLSNFPFKVLTLIAHLPIHTHILRNTVKTRPPRTAYKTFSMQTFPFSFPYPVLYPPFCEPSWMSTRPQSNIKKVSQAQESMVYIYV